MQTKTCIGVRTFSTCRDRPCILVPFVFLIFFLYNTVVMSERCYKCYKPVSACLCKFIQEIDCGIKFVFLILEAVYIQYSTRASRLIIVVFCIEMCPFYRFFYSKALLFIKHYLPFANKVVDSRRSMGLGLPLCKSIVNAQERHHGSLHI